MKLNRKLSIGIGLALYKTIGHMLPKTEFFIPAIGRLGKKFRGLCGRLILDSCGKNVNICKHARFSSRVSLGNNSGIGHYANITGKCMIGDNVIMGPQVSIFTTNHRTDSTSVPIKYQGNTEERPVYIGDDCWIGYRSIILGGCISVGAA